MVHDEKLREACLFLILGKIKLNMKNSSDNPEKKEKQLTVAILITTHVVQFYSRIYNSLLCCLMQKFGKSLQDKILSSPFTFSLEHTDCLFVLLFYHFLYNFDYLRQGK
jgi:hypothetical protein